MAKKPAPKKAAAPTTPAKGLTPTVSPAGVEIDMPIAETPVRKTVAPKAAISPTTPAKKAPAPVTYERIAERAYYISQRGHGGSEHDNWCQAERELKNETI